MLATIQCMAEPAVSSTKLTASETTSGAILENVMDGETLPPVHVNMASIAPPSAHGVVIEKPVPTVSATVVTIAMDCV